MPTYLAKNQKITLYFALPEDVRRLSAWYAVCVFSSPEEIQTKTYPDTVFADFSFPEKDHARDLPASDENARSRDAPAVFEEIVKTKSDKRQQLTFFVMLPERKPVSGVLTLCLLANHPDDIRRQLESSKPVDEIGKQVRFARTNQLAVVAWGSSKNLWNPRKNWDELSKERETHYGEAFDVLADAWERGMLEISRKYQLPKGRYLSPRN